jgi:NitT/TauT family transport system ATP-binding protein
MIDRSSHIIVKHASKAFGSGPMRAPVLHDISLEIKRGELVTIFGPNGSGKTTFLNVLAGIETLDEGSLTINSSGGIPRVGYVFQDYRGNLMPWLTVAENIAFPLKIRNVPKRQRLKQVEALLARFNLKLDLDARTYTLSGGQAQIASIVRALIIEPEILIMDEPFSALDYQTNLALYEKVFFIWQSSHVTILLVSHDIDTALYLGERTVFLTKRPASIAGILENKLTGPKELSQMASNDFAVLKRQALEIFQREALRR